MARIQQSDTQRVHFSHLFSNPGPENTWIFSEMLSVSTKHRSDKQNYWRSVHSYWENVLVYHSSCAPVFTRIPTPWSCWPKINTKQTWLIMLAFSSPVVCTGWRVICFHLNGINVYRRVTKGDYHIQPNERHGYMASSAPSTSLLRLK